MESRTKLPLHYWLCNCAEKGHRIHPSNHDVCLTCDKTEDRADLAPAGEVQAFFQSNYDLPLELVEVT